MTLKGDNSCTTENCTLRVTGPAWTGSIMSPKDVVDDPLNPDKIRPGFSRPARLCPIWPMTDACTRSAELPGSTKIRLTSKSPISRERMRASRCGCSVRVGSTGGKMIVPSMGRGPSPVWAPVDIVYDSLGGDWGPRGPRVMMLRCVPSSSI
ncbi:hypothetical protein CK203_096802 [Vitis vinifera]|uniref:Uncharacterized protein n=1 Tax=Vitis vinifera TaxID=29760 RepID=A0A438EJM7_VITVI|nr:hypothetical protein CK203_096802 [Vitis vinifera]